MEISRRIGIIFGRHSGIFPRSREKVNNGPLTLTCVKLDRQSNSSRSVCGCILRYPATAECAQFGGQGRMWRMTGDSKNIISTIKILTDTCHQNLSMHRGFMDVLEDAQ